MKRAKLQDMNVCLAWGIRNDEGKDLSKAMGVNLEQFDEECDVSVDSSKVLMDPEHLPTDFNDMF